MRRASPAAGIHKRYFDRRLPLLDLPPHDATDSEFDYEDDEGRYIALELTLVFNLVGQCPAITVPSGLTPSGLPSALQIVGRRFDDVTALRIAAALEEPIGWPDWRPPQAMGQAGG